MRRVEIRHCRRERPFWKCNPVWITSVLERAGAFVRVIDYTCKPWCSCTRGENHMRHSYVLLAVLAMTAMVCQGQTNVALGKPVTLNGSFTPFVYVCGGGAAEPPASIVTDGVFFPEGTCYQSGIYWTGTTNTVDIDLQGTFLISAATVQADDNDIYTLQYRDVTGVYHDWWNVPIQGGFGLITRPSVGGQMTLPAVVATGLRFFAPAGSGDNAYAVSEIQAFGVPVMSDTPYQVNYAANLSSGESFIDVINTGANGAPLLGPGLGTAVGNICLNVYAFDPGEEMVSCCSCLVTPDQVVNLGVNRDLTSKTLTGVIPSSLTVKMVATLAGANCNNSATAGGVPTAGFAAFGTTLHARGTTFDTVERKFVPSTLSAGEYASMTGRCASIVGNASTFGVCATCRQGALGAQKQ